MSNFDWNLGRKSVNFQSFSVCLGKQTFMFNPQQIISSNSRSRCQRVKIHVRFCPRLNLVIEGLAWWENISELFFRSQQWGEKKWDCVTTKSSWLDSTKKYLQSRTEQVFLSKIWLQYVCFCTVHVCRVMLINSSNLSYIRSGRMARSLLLMVENHVQETIVNCTWKI